MLNFEDEVKKTQAGYVVMSLEEYNKLQDKILDYSVRAVRAESDVRLIIQKTKQDATQRLHNLLFVHKKAYGDKAIEITFNNRAIHELAVEVLEETYTFEELAEYAIKPADDLLLCDEVLARLKE